MNTQTGEIHPSLQAAIMAGVRPEFAMEIIPTRKQRRAMKVGRNDPCPCGSGIKFKKCHLGKPVA